MDFGPELRRRRIAAGLSLGQLAGQLHYSKGYLSRIENSQRLPNVRLARRCDAVLEAGGVLASLVPDSGGPAGESPLDPFGADQEVWITTLDADGTTRFSSLSRREAMCAAGMSVLGVVAGVGPSASSHQDLAPIFGSLFREYRRMGQVTHPGMMVPQLISQTGVVRAAAESTNGSRGRELFRLASRYAEYTGWMIQESGNDQIAAWWTGVAVDLAARAGDPTMAAYANVRRALITLYRNEGARTVDLARQAQTDPSVAARVRGLAAQREAQGHALLGAETQCRRALDRAAELLRDGPAHSAEPVLGTSHVLDPVAMTTGWCLYDLGRGQQAVGILEAQLRRVPGDAHRTRARYGARLALAYTDTAEIDRACAVTHQALDHADPVGSATIRVDLRRLHRTLARWQQHKPVAELRPRLVAAVHGTSVT